MSTIDKIVGLNELLDTVHKWKAAGHQIVFTNGCFDILHLGHVDYLEKSSQLGQRLIVGVNSDTSVRQIKGDNRPINDEETRSRILASLQYVDAVVLFEESTPEALIGMILPDVLVKGSDYHRGNIVGAEIVEQNGGKVETIDLIPGYSTTQIIEKIRLK